MVSELEIDVVVREHFADYLDDKRNAPLAQVRIKDLSIDSIDFVAILLQILSGLELTISDATLKVTDLATLADVGALLAQLAAQGSPT